MASEFIIEQIKSNKNKDNASLMGYIYTLNRLMIFHFGYVKNVHSSCKTRIHSRNDITVKPVLVS